MFSQELTIYKDAPGDDNRGGQNSDDPEKDDDDYVNFAFATAAAAAAESLKQSWGEHIDEAAATGVLFPDTTSDEAEGDAEDEDEAEDDDEDDAFATADDGGGKESGDDESQCPGTRALRHLRDAVESNFFDDDSDDDEPMIVRKYSSPVRRGRPTSKKFGKKKPGEGASVREREAYEKERKAHYDMERMKKLKSPNKRPVSDYSGNHHPTLRTMNDVEKGRLSKGQTFQTRKVLLLRTKEEANLRGISIKVEKSDALRFICWSRDEPEFVVIAYQSEEKGYEVKHALVRDMDTDDTWNGIIPGGKLFVPN